MNRNDIHRLHVLPLSEAGKTARCLMASIGGFLRAIVQGCNRRLFFACSGNGAGTSWNNRGSNGNYWSSSFNSARNARNLNFNSGGVNPQDNNNRYNGFAVRPVQHTILVILFLLILLFCGAHTAATIARPLSSLLRCETAEIQPVVCEEVGKEPQAEYGGLVRRSVLSPLHADAVQVLYRKLSEEAGDICCDVPRQDCASSILQLYAQSIRTDIYSGQLQLHSRPWHALWNRPNTRLLPQRESQLATEVLCAASRHTRLFHAHHSSQAAGDSHIFSEQNGNASYLEWKQRNVGRQVRYGLHALADRSDCNARPEEELHHRGVTGRLDWVGLCQVDASLVGGSRTANRKPHVATILECLSQPSRPVREERTEMPLLRTICGRCRHSERRPRMAAVISSENKRIFEAGTWAGVAHGQVGNNRSSPGCGVPRSFHQAVADIYLQSLAGSNPQEN